MPQLIKQTGEQWHSVTNEQEIIWQTPEEWHPGAPLLLEGDSEPQPEHKDACCIAINFPAFNDGRGLSLAVLLRTRMGFSGELRATGAVHEDILHYMIRCGFDAIELPDDRSLESALEIISPYSDHYQASVSNPAPAFRRTSRGS